MICEIMADDGNMARMPQLEDFAEQHDVKIVSVEDLIAYRRMHERLIERVAEARVPTEYGEFRAVSYSSVVDVQEHVAFVKGDIKDNEPALVRVHSECLTGDVFGSKRCDCGYQVQLALEAIEKYGSGVLLYMRQEGRGIGIHNKLKAYNLQDQGLDTVDANVELGFAPDLRHYGVGAQILVDLGVRKIRLLTNNPKKVVGLESFGIHTIERVPIIGSVNDENSRYLNTKREKMGHILEETVDIELVAALTETLMYRVDEVADQLMGVEYKRSEEHTSELQSLVNLVCRLLLEKKKKTKLYVQINNKKSKMYHQQYTIMAM